jgi:hypothetical protein
LSLVEAELFQAGTAPKHCAHRTGRERRKGCNKKSLQGNQTATSAGEEGAEAVEKLPTFRAPFWPVSQIQKKVREGRVYLTQPRQPLWLRAQTAGDPKSPNARAEHAEGVKRPIIYWDLRSEGEVAAFG